MTRMEHIVALGVSASGRGAMEHYMELYRKEVVELESKSDRYIPMWDQYKLEEAYQQHLRERALEVRGPRNEDPTAPCTMWGCTSHMPHVHWCLKV